jgi:hypothetical protein
MKIRSYASVQPATSEPDMIMTGFDISDPTDEFESDGGKPLDYFEGFDRYYTNFQDGTGIDYDYEQEGERFTEWVVILVALVDGEVRQIARSEHVDGGMHDVTEEAVHIDLIDPRTEDPINNPRKQTIGHYDQPREAMNAAIKHLTENREVLVRRYKQWQQ